MQSIPVSRREPWRVTSESTNWSTAWHALMTRPSLGVFWYSRSDFFPGEELLNIVNSRPARPEKPCSKLPVFPCPVGQRGAGRFSLFWLVGRLSGGGRERGVGWVQDPRSARTDGSLLRSSFGSTPRQNNRNGTQTYVCTYTLCSGRESRGGTSHLSKSATIRMTSEQGTPLNKGHTQCPPYWRASSFI